MIAQVRDTQCALALCVPLSLCSHSVRTVLAQLSSSHHSRSAYSLFHCAPSLFLSKELNAKTSHAHSLILTLSLSLCSHSVRTVLALLTQRSLCFSVTSLLSNFTLALRLTFMC